MKPTPRHEYVVLHSPRHNITVDTDLRSDKHNIYALTVMGCFWLNATRDKKGVIMTKERGHIRKRRFAIAETSRVHKAKDVFIKVWKENLHDPTLESVGIIFITILYFCSVARNVVRRSTLIWRMPAWRPKDIVRL